jgi:type IV secretory pathway VirD2 relaxase
VPVFPETAEFGGAARHRFSAMPGWPMIAGLMPSDDQFEPELGRLRARGSRRQGRFLGRVIAATNVARGGGPGTSGKAGFSGSRIGRGAGAGRLLASRDSYAAFRQRRVIIKSRIVRLSGKAVANAKAHLRYVERDGTSRDGSRSQLYGAGDDQVDGRSFLDRSTGDRHQFRFIVSPEDGLEYDDLKEVTRRLMKRMEEDLGTSLDWVAVDHFDTGHPHSHIIVRGKDDRGKDLIIARDYMSHGMRERACELIDLDLGPRGDQAIEQRLRAEISQERLTSIDRSLLREADADGVTDGRGRSAFEQTIRIGRLKKLERLGLARSEGRLRWRLDPGLSNALRRMGERGDIVRTMLRTYAARRVAPALADRLIYEPASDDARPLVGQVIARGLSDELHDRHYLIVEATDGRSHYVDIGKMEGVDVPTGSIVRIEPIAPRARDSDRTVAAVAASNKGRYNVDLHLAHDPAATQAFAEAHVRRLEAIRRTTGGVTRNPDGTWIVAADYLGRAAAYEMQRASNRPVAIETLSPVPLEKLVGAEAATWLDRQLVADQAEPLRAAGFGGEVSHALAQRRQWLLNQGLVQGMDEETVYRPGMIDILRRRELLRVAAQLSSELDLPFVETVPGSRVGGTLRRAVDLLSGRMALVETSREFTLVPWRPVLDRHIGKSLTGVMRQEGVSWTLGRGRSGPTIS